MKKYLVLTGNLLNFILTVYKNWEANSKETFHVCSLHSTCDFKHFYHITFYTWSPLCHTNFLLFYRLISPNSEEIDSVLFLGLFLLFLIYFQCHQHLLNLGHAKWTDSHHGKHSLYFDTSFTFWSDTKD